MVYLQMSAKEFGLEGVEYVRAPYETVEEAKAQAEHNIVRNTQRPLRIVDETGNVLVNYEE